MYRIWQMDVRHITMICPNRPAQQKKERKEGGTSLFMREGGGMMSRYTRWYTYAIYLSYEGRGDSTRTWTHHVNVLIDMKSEGACTLLLFGGALQWISSWARVGEGRCNSWDDECGRHIRWVHHYVIEKNERVRKAIRVPSECAYL